MTKRVTCGNCKSDFTISTEVGVDTEKFTRMFYEKARTTSWSRGERVLFIGSQDCPLCSSTEIPERVKKQLVKVLREEKVRREYGGGGGGMGRDVNVNSERLFLRAFSQKAPRQSVNLDSPGSALRPSSTGVRTIINATRTEWPSLSAKTPSTSTQAATKSFAEMAKNTATGDSAKKLIVQVPCKYCRNPTDTTSLKNGQCSKCFERYSHSRAELGSHSVTTHSNRVAQVANGVHDVDEDVDEVDDYDAPEDADVADREEYD